MVWGLRVENFDQLVGSVKKWDPRHTYSKVTDYLPGVNATIKLSQKANLRITGSQTVIRPELRELSALNIYDFELNAAVSGNPSLKRTKITNTDFRYELYPAAGELFTVGVFYKSFENQLKVFFRKVLADLVYSLSKTFQKQLPLDLKLKQEKNYQKDSLYKRMVLISIRKLMTLL